MLHFPAPPRLPSGLGRVTCFGPWNVSRCGTSRGAKRGVHLSLPLALLPARGPGLPREQAWRTVAAARPARGAVSREGLGRWSHSIAVAVAD